MAPEGKTETIPEEEVAVARCASAVHPLRIRSASTTASAPLFTQAVNLVDTIDTFSLCRR